MDGTGIDCWDTNDNKTCDTNSEDVNDDGACDVDDCVGARGPEGPTGPQGAVGPAGPAGPAGAAGPAGIVGPQGAVGARGPQGLQGAVGPQGLPGNAGLQGAVGAVGPRASLIAEYEFDEDPNAFEFNDSSGQANKVTGNQGVFTAGSATAHSGKSIQFTGVEGVQAAAGNAILDSSQINPEMWIRTSQPGGTFTLLEKTGSYRLRMASGQLTWTVTTTGGACTVTHPGPIASDTWTHVSGLFDGLSAVVEIDGVTRSVACKSGRVAPTPGAVLAIGGKFAGGWSEVFRGYIDEVRVRASAEFTVGKVTGACGTGQAITAIGPDGSLSCGAAAPQRVIRYNVFDTYHENCCWVASNRADLFGGVNPSNWTDNNYQANNMSNSAEVLRTLFNRKMYPGSNAIVNSERFVDNNSTSGKVTVALLRIKNTTQGAIDWTAFIYFTAYASWSERASLSLNGQNTWNSGGGNYWPNSTASITMSIPANQTSTVILVSTGGPLWSTTGNYRFTMLAFYNDSLNLPNGLQFVDDLETVQGNLW